jgi:hypothetical protein
VYFSHQRKRKAHFLAQSNGNNFSEFRTASEKPRFLLSKQEIGETLIVVNSNKTDNVYINVIFRARSLNHFCRRKAENIKYYECVSLAVSYPECKAHAPYYIVICGLSGSIIVFHIIS